MGEIRGRRVSRREELVLNVALTTVPAEYIVPCDGGQGLYYPENRLGTNMQLYYTSDPHTEDPPCMISVRNLARSVRGSMEVLPHIGRHEKTCSWRI